MCPPWIDTRYRNKRAREINRCLRYEDQHFGLFCCETVCVVCKTRWYVINGLSQKTKRNENWKSMANSSQIPLLFIKCFKLCCHSACVIRHSIDVTRLNLTNQTHPIRSDPKSRCHYGWAKIKTHCRLTLVYNVDTIHTRCGWCNKNFYTLDVAEHTIISLALMYWISYLRKCIHAKCLKLKQQRQQQLQFDTSLYRWVHFCVSTVQMSSRQYLFVVAQLMAKQTTVLPRICL